MPRYTNMTDTQLDGLILLAFFPKNQGKVNLSDRDSFINLIVKKIEENDLIEEFGENVASFFHSPYKNTKSVGVCAYACLMSDIRIYKMAALKTYDDFKGTIKC